MDDTGSQRIGNYEILATLEAGGTGPVYHALHLQLARPAAVKVLREDLASDPIVVRRFQREARIAAQLHHPNIVEIYDTGEHEGSYFIARGLIQGRTLREVLDEGLPTSAETVRYARQIAAALDHAHERGVIHRDLNPTRILLDRRGNVTVIDFGIAGAIEDLPLSGTASVETWFDAPAYVSPEQATGQPAMPQSDIYALGAIVYEMLTGQPPFTELQPAEIVPRLLMETPAPPRERNPHLSEGIDDVVMAALSKSPTDRYATATAFVDDLQRVLGTDQPRYAVTGPPVGMSPEPSMATPEPVIVERIVYRSRKYEPAVWYGIGTTLLALALFLNLLRLDVDDNDGGALADAVLTATATNSVVAPTSTVARAPSPMPTVSATSVPPTRAATTTPPPTSTPSPTATPSPTPPPPPPSLSAGGELILFVSTRGDGSPRLYLMEPDGEEQLPALEDPASIGAVTNVESSPDGRRLALAASPAGESEREIYLVDIATSQIRRLTDSAGDNTMPRWSPDGALIAFLSTRDGNSEIYRMNADGGDQRNLSNNGADDYGLAVSPSSGQIAFVSNRIGNNEILLMDANGENLTNLTNNPAADWGPTWSPDGGQIAFGTNRMGNDEIFIMNADGSSPSNLSGGPAADNLPVWSPAGDWIAFVSDRTGAPTIIVSTPDGEDVRTIGPTLGSASAPAWSPDGSALAFTVTENATSDIYSAAIDSGQPRRLTDDGADDFAPLWVNLPEGGS